MPDWTLKQHNEKIDMLESKILLLFTVSGEKTISRKVLIKSYGTCLVQEAIWSLVEQGKVRWDDTYENITEIK